MSELINTKSGWRDLRWELLVSVSSVALLASVCGMQDANAEDADRPTVWIELGADLDRVDGGQQAFAPPFVANNPGSTAFDPISPGQAQRPPRFSFGGEGKLSLQPEDSNWVFAASVRYGRSNGQRNIHQTAKNGPQYAHFGYNGPYAHIDGPPSSPIPFVANFLAVAEKQSESHAVIDFQAGRDFGLGLFGREGTSVLNAGIRFAQFATRMQSNIQARPDLKFVEFNIHTPYHPHNYGTEYGHHYHQYLATAQSARSFRGIGPSLSWNAAAPIVGNPEGGQLSVDWGANAAILFGRQKAKVQHKTSAVYFASNYAHLKYPNGLPGASYQHPEVNNQRARSVTVPNVGGFAGVMFSFTNFKASVGYRGDFFFDAMDTGFDSAKRSTIGFYGPFATVSVGFGG